MSSPTVSMMARHVQSPPEHFGWIEPELSSYRLEPGQSVSEFPFRRRVLLGRERRIRRRIVAKHLLSLVCSMSSRTMNSAFFRSDVAGVHLV
jgi:hypothetical protein